MDKDIANKIETIISDNKVVLFMKGSKSQPMCGFSSRVVQILDHLNADYKDINVMEDETVRQGIKDFSDWPTIPQLYVNKEFIGGCDIVTEMFTEGELQKVLEPA